MFGNYHFWFLVFFLAFAEKKPSNEVFRFQKYANTPHRGVNHNQASISEVPIREKSDSSAAAFFQTTPLEKLYQRGLVTLDSSKIIFDLPFDLHGWDCGAPDCYTTAIHFEWYTWANFMWSEAVHFTLHEYGCVDEEVYISSTFQLIEATDRYANYYCAEQRSNLIFLSQDERKEYIYYFTDVAPDAIQVAQLKQVLEQDPEAENSLVPFRSSRMFEQ